MADPSAALFIPHIVGLTLDGEGVAQTLVIATNRTNGEKQRLRTDSNKNVIFDAAEFTSGYIANDIIEFNNVGSSVGTATITITNATGGFQQVTMDCAAAPTVSVNL